jgi:heme oxygenase
MTRPPVLTALREATREAHEALESITYGDRILDGSLGVGEYRRLLEWQRRSYGALEPLVGRVRGKNYRYRSRFDHSVPTSPQLTLPEQVGLLYVLEGSSLGGSVIYRKLLENPRLAGEAPFTFYHQQAEWGVRQWRSFLGYLGTLSLTGEDERTAARSARRAFATFRSEWEAVR